MNMLRLERRECTEVLTADDICAVTMRFASFITRLFDTIIQGLPASREHPPARLLSMRAAAFEPAPDNDKYDNEE